MVARASLRSNNREGHDIAIVLRADMHPPDPPPQAGVERGDSGQFPALGRVIEMHSDAVASCGHGLRAHPHADPTTPVRQPPAQAPTRPPLEQADHPLRHAAPAPAQRCAWRRRPPPATGQAPLRRCIVDPHADGRRPWRDRRRRQRLPDRCIHVRRLTAAPLPAHQCPLADARRIPTAHGIPRGIPQRGRTINEQRPRFRMTCPPTPRSADPPSAWARARRRSPRPCIHAPLRAPDAPLWNGTAAPGAHAAAGGAPPPDPPALRPPGQRPRAAGPVPHSLPVRHPRARLVRRTPPVPPFMGRFFILPLPDAVAARMEAPPMGQAFSARVQRCTAQREAYP